MSNAKQETIAEAHVQVQVCVGSLFANTPEVPIL